MAASAEATASLESLLPEVHTWSGQPQASEVALLPGCPAVFLFVDGRGAPVQLLTAQHLRRVVLSRLSGSPPRTRRADLAGVVRGVRWRPVHSGFETRWWHYRVARVLHPDGYRKLVGFGPAWFLHIDWSRRVPEPRVTERIWCQPGDCIGPWPTQRACQQALDGLRDVFDLCRYPEQVRKAPAGTACAYAEMGRCDAPCDGSAPLPRYVERLRAAWAFAAGEIESWMQSATQRMRHAAAQQRYELAALLRQQLEFARLWRERWLPVVRPAAQLQWLLVLPATRRKAWKPFLFREGDLTDGPLIAEHKLAVEVPGWLTGQLSRPAAALDAVVRMEQTWLVAHFLQHREAQSAIVLHVPQGNAPSGLDRLLEEARTRRAAAKDAPPR